VRLLVEFIKFIGNITSNRKLLIALAVDDFKQQYFGSYLGFFWAFVKPSVFIGAIWFVFEVGFRVSPVTNDVPFVLWLMSGFAAWFYFTTALSSGVNAVISKRHLVKKVDFRVSILPLVTTLSALIIHVMFLSIVGTIFFLNNFFPSIYWLQLPFYIFSLSTLLLGLNWLISSVRIFVKDIESVISIILQVGFWGTPIFWSIERVPLQYQYIIKLNPMYFVVTGYRETFVGEQWFWERGSELGIFLVTTLFLFFLGAVVFKRLRPHFGDVL